MTGHSPTATVHGGAGDEPSETPALDSLRANQKSDPVLDPVPDGHHWSWDSTSDGENVTFTLVQYSYGDACREQFGDSEDACASADTTFYPSNATMGMADTAATSVLTCCDEGSFISYRASTTEFARLVAGLAPSPDAPAGFTYAPDGVIVTVRNGQAITAEQIFTSSRASSRSRCRSCQHAVCNPYWADPAPPDGAPPRWPSRSSRRSRAARTAARRLVTASSRWIALHWIFTVFGGTSSSRAISGGEGVHGR